jgi:hypothetical protein
VFYFNFALIQRQFVDSLFLARENSGRIQQIIFLLEVGDNGSVVGNALTFDLVLFSSLLMDSLNLEHGTLQM